MLARILFWGVRLCVCVHVCFRSFSFLGFIFVREKYVCGTTRVFFYCCSFLLPFFVTWMIFCCCLFSIFILVHTRTTPFFYRFFSIIFFFFHFFCQIFHHVVHAPTRARLHPRFFTLVVRVLRVLIGRWSKCVGTFWSFLFRAQIGPTAPPPPLVPRCVSLAV